MSSPRRLMALLLASTSACFGCAVAQVRDQAPKDVIQIITIIDSSNGEVLDTEIKVMPHITLSGDRIEDCRVEAVARAKEVLVPWYSARHPYAFSNVIRHWQDSNGKET
jgi:hypothetical protein